MDFIVTYRNPAGGKAQIEVSAESRSQLFEILSSKGIRAITVGEGKISRPHLGKSRPLLRGAAALLLVCISAGLAFLFVRTTASDRKPDVEARRHEIQNAEKTARHSFVAKTQTDKTAKFAKPEIENSDIFLENQVKPKIIKWEHHEKPVFQNDFENYVGGVLTAIPGERFFDIDLEEEFDRAFEASLTNRIEILADDSEDVIMLKKAVIDAKEQVRLRVQEGKTPREVVTEAREELNKIADYRDQLQEEFNKYLLKGDDPQEVLKFAQEANELLAEYGALPLEAPDDVDGAYEALIGAKQGAVEEMDFLEEQRRIKEKRQKERLDNEK